MSEKKGQKRGRAFGKRQRERLVEAAGGRCQGCGAELPRRDNTNQGRRALEVHHVHPRSRGGTNSNTNAAVLCNPKGCHDDANELVMRYNVPFTEVKARMGAHPFAGFRGRRVERPARKGSVRHILRRLRSS